MKPLVYSTAAYSYLGDAIAQHGGWEHGAITRKTFPDGERYPVSYTHLTLPTNREV